jgi:hypothetical protein
MVSKALSLNSVIPYNSNGLLAALSSKPPIKLRRLSHPKSCPHTDDDIVNGEKIKKNMFKHVSGEKCKFELPAKECKLEESTFYKLAVHTAQKDETDVNM